MKNKKLIPLHQLIYAIILILLIIFRIIFNTLSLYINLVNYISMVVSISSVWITTIIKAQKSRKKNICKSIFIITLLVFVAFGSLILIIRIDTPTILNDIFTLIALLFSICNTIFELIIKDIFSLKYKNE